MASPAHALRPLSGTLSRPSPHAVRQYCTVLLAPGPGGSDFGGSLDAFERVRADWNVPDLEAWAGSIVAAALRAPGPAIVVAQGLACLAILRADRLHPGTIDGALLLAPVDPAQLGLHDPAWNQAPGFAGVVVDAEDPGQDPARAWSLALRWDCQLAGISRRQGQERGGVAGLLEQLCRRVSAPN